jgi:hypothetical protein
VPIFLQPIPYQPAFFRNSELTDSRILPLVILSGHVRSASTSSMPGQNHDVSFTPYPPTSSPYARRASHHPPRPDSPPSSAFFSSHLDDDHEMQPSPDAQRHFGSSTSFRRHGGVSNSQNAAFESIRSAVIEEGPSGIWDRLVGLAKGVRYGSTPEENGYELAPKVDQTPSAKYSSYDAEVRSSPLRYPSYSLRKGCGRTSSPSSEPPVPMA